ncbi:hypothetical protein [Actinoplanes sp. NPDC023714]|uniref:hypothetical protein n=1 Tax=Actinoplanes sp. NPDC023714 TaxID=3154322 RepID=UPI0033FFE590
MNPLTPAIVVFAAAAVVSAAGAGLDSSKVQYGAEAVAMLALSAGAALSGRHRALRLFGLLLAAAALADLAAAWLPYPDPAANGQNGCPVADEQTTDFWTSRLRLAQIAAALHCGALICATLAVSALPRRPGLRPWHRSLLITFVAIPAILIGLYPIYSADDLAELLHPTMPATLTLLAAAALTVLTVTRAPGGWARTAALIGGGVLSLVPGLFVLEKVADPIVQLRYLAPPPPGVFIGCAYAYGTPASLSTIALTGGGVLLVLAGPALLLWASPRITGH